MEKKLGNSVEDLMFLVGYVKKPKNVASKWVRDIETEAENAWMDGKNADANPYGKEYTGNIKADVWYKMWLNCNKNL